MREILTIVLTFSLLGCAALCGVLLGGWLTRNEERFEDGPQPRPLHPLWPIALMMALGVWLFLRQASPVQLFFVGLTAVPLIAAWYADAKTGLVPDLCTLVPLLVVLAYAAIDHHWVTWFSALVIFVPFALAAFFSKGVGMGWGDVKLATLCAAIVGMVPATLAFAVASFCAICVAYFRDKGRSPIAFGPYIVVSTFGALALTFNAG